LTLTKNESTVLFIDPQKHFPATVNFTEPEIPYTRIIEHKHFQPHRVSSTKKTVVTYEYPDDWSRDKVPYYPINNDENTEIYRNTTKSHAS